MTTHAHHEHHPDVAPAKAGAQSSKTKRIVVALLALGAIVFIFYGLYLAQRPVFAPLQGQVDARYIDVSPKIQGRVLKLHAVEGDEVKSGALLVTLDSPEVEAKVSQAKATHSAAAARQQLLDHGIRQEDVRAAQADWERASASTKLAEATFRRNNALYKEGLISAQHNDEIETSYLAAQETERAARARYDLTQNGFRHEERAAAADMTRAASAAVDEVDALAADISLKSPLNAEVDKVILHVGELAPPGFPVMTLVNLDDVWAVFNLREDEMRDVRMGTTLTGTVPALGGESVKFVVYYVSPKGEYATWRATRQSSGYDVKTFEVRARPAEKVAGLRPGMSVLVARG
jgi:HlyD family secretion protein